MLMMMMTLHLSFSLSLLTILLTNSENDWKKRGPHFCSDLELPPDSGGASGGSGGEAAAAMANSLPQIGNSTLTMILVELGARVHLCVYNSRPISVT